MILRINLRSEPITAPLKNTHLGQMAGEVEGGASFHSSVRRPAGRMSQGRDHSHTPAWRGGGEALLGAGGDSRGEGDMGVQHSLYGS